MDRLEFINKISHIIVRENLKRGKPLFASVVIAQACLETGFGSSSLMMKANAVFGIKASLNWKGKVYNSRTREVYNDRPVNILAYFRAYNSLEESVKDYFDLICGLERYRKALSAENPAQCIFEIKNGGYATDPNYDRLVINIIKEYNLTQYDDYSELLYDEDKTTIDKTVEKTFDSYYSIGKNYKLNVNLYVREGPGTDKRILNRNELTKDGQAHSKNITKALLTKGTIVTLKDFKFLNNDIWLKIPSGWIAGYYKGEYYVN